MAPSGDLIRFWRSKVKAEGQSRPSTWRRHPRRLWGITVHLLVECHTLTVVWNCGTADAPVWAESFVIWRWCARVPACSRNQTPTEGQAQIIA